MSIFNHFQHLSLSTDQEAALKKIESFLESPVQVFILKGYAGSGKTTILKGLVNYLSTIEKEFALMAPTGRAAKVIREKTGQEAFTIHKSIYSYDDLVEVKDADSFYYQYKIRNNVDVAGKIFIVDEASMLSDAKSEGEFFRFGTSHLLSDLITFTRANQPTAKSKLIFVGDPCQLPPVGDNSSKAFDPEYLRKKFNLSSLEVEMKEVKRQQGNSGILSAASKIRKSISSGYFNDFNLRPNGSDIINPPYEIFLDAWDKAASPKIIITYKNKTCLDLNLQIRERRFGNADLPVQKNDIIILGGNNYRKGVLNGEFAVVNSVSSSSESRTIVLKGQQPVQLTWREVELVFPDAESENKTVKGKIIENFLYGDNFLKPTETQALYVDFINRHPGLKRGSEEFKQAIMKDDYFNCLLIKFGYAVTCHKAQGGEWDNVFTVWDYDNRDNFDCFKDPQKRAGKTNQDFYRWAYTAITRASKHLFALNPPFFNSYSSLTFLDTDVTNTLASLTGKTTKSEDVSIDNELTKQLAEFDLFNQPLPLQDHFIRVRHAVRKQYIEITGWEKIGYEVRYHFSRESAKASVKTFVNGKNEFKNPLVIMPGASKDESFNSVITQIVNNLPDITVLRNTIETVLGKIEFEWDIEEQYPFTKALFDDLKISITQRNIKIVDIEHLQYKERYTFKRDQEDAIIDFEYRKDGFFGRAVPLVNKCNSEALISDIHQELKNLKEQEYASEGN